jgi:uncharacterized OB-fold protein
LELVTNNKTMQSPVKIWRNQKKIRNLLGCRGVIISWTKVHVPPSGFESHAPYIVAIADLGEKGKYTAQLVDYKEEELVTGLKIRVVLRKTIDTGQEAVIPYGMKFTPLR